MKEALNASVITQSHISENKTESITVKQDYVNMYSMSVLTILGTGVVIAAYDYPPLGQLHPNDHWARNILLLHLGSGVVHLYNTLIQRFILSKRLRTKARRPLY